MGLFSKDKVSIPKINTLEVAREGGQAAEALAPTVSNLFKSGVTSAGEGAQSAFRTFSGLAPEIQAQREALNAPLFAGIEAQEALASGDLAQRLQQEASERLGTGLTFDEERALRESSRAAFTDRGLFRSNPALVDEIVRRQQADRQARMQNNMFAQNALGFQQGLLQQPIANRRSLFLDPGQGLSAGNIFAAGAGLGQQALGAGVGISQQAAAANQQAQAAQNMANRRGGLFGDVLKGFGGAFAGQAGRALGGALF